MRARGKQRREEGWKTGSRACAAGQGEGRKGGSKEGGLEREEELGWMAEGKVGGDE